MGCLFAFAVVMGFVLLFGYDKVLESRWFFSVEEGNSSELLGISCVPGTVLGALPLESV